MIKKLLLSLIFPFIVANAQTTCSGGFAGSYPCSNYDLMSFIPMSTFNVPLDPAYNLYKGSDCWGWVDPLTNREYGIMGVTNGTIFIDITDPINPVYLGKLSIPSGRTNSAWRDIKVYNNHAYVVSDVSSNNYGMQIFDLTRLRNVTNPPATFTQDSYFNNGFDDCHNVVINETTGIAYLVGCSTYGGGPVFIDLSNPINPTSLGGYQDPNNSYSHDAQVITYTGPDTAYTGKEIYFGAHGNYGGPNEMYIIDVTNKSNPTVLSTFGNYTDPNYTHQCWISDDQRYLFFGDEEDETNVGLNTRTFVMDITDLNNPIFLGEYTASNGSIDHNGYIKGNKYYLASYSAGMRVIDITNMANPASYNEFGYFDTHPSTNNAVFQGSWSVYPYFPSQNIIISDMTEGFFVVRESGVPLNINTDTLKTFKIFPNPATNKLTIQADNNNSILNVSIIDLLGRTINTQTFSELQKVDIHLKDLKKGIYFVKINNTTVRKFVVN